MQLHLKSSRMVNSSLRVTHLSKKVNMDSRVSILLMICLALFSFCKGLNEPVGDVENIKEELHAIKKNLQPNVTIKSYSKLINEERILPTIIESDEPTDTILQNLTTDIVQAELIDAEADETEEGLRQKRRAGRVTVRVCNRRRRRRCRYVIVIRRRRRRRRY